MKTRKTIRLTLALTLLSITTAIAQTKNLFGIPLDTNVTYDAIIAKYGEPKDINGQEGQARSLYYHLNVADDYMYGWMIIRVNAKNKYCGYSLKGQHNYRQTERTLNAFQSKFNLPQHLVDLFYMSEKDLKAKLSENGVSMEKQKSGLDYHYLYSLRGFPSMYSDIQITIGKGKLFEKSKDDKITRQGKIYQLEVDYPNRFQK